MSHLDPLHALARVHGLELGYTDIEGRHQAAPVETIMRVLSALDVPIDDPAQAAERLTEARLEHWRRRVDPVCVAWDGGGTLVLRRPARSSTDRYRITVTDADGWSETTEGSLGDRPTLETCEVAGETFVAHTLPLPPRLPSGYLDLRIELDDPAEVLESLVLSAPRRVYLPAGGSDERVWGVFLPLYALHTERSLGTADFTDLGSVIDWVADRGGSVVGTLPLLAAFLREPCEPSPYAPASRLAWNELYLDVEEIPEVVGCEEARRLLGDPDVRRAFAQLRDAEHLDHAAAMALKRRILEPASEHAHATERSRRLLEAFAAERPELVDYARFRAVAERRASPWPTWPDRLREGIVAEGDFDPRAFRYHLFVQWNAHRQLSALAHRARKAGLGLYLDLPIGVHGDGYDTWRHTDVFARRLDSGAPPDSLFAGGQNWAFPPLHPHALRKRRYEHFIAVIRNHLRYAGMLRIDHVMGLHRIYAIPHGARATEGMYIRYRPEEMYAILSLESHRSKALLLGENLGTVPEEVSRALVEHGVHGMHVLQYAVRPDPQAALPVPNAGVVASLNTHDMPPFAAFWRGLDIDERRRLGWIDDQEVAVEHARRAQLRSAMRSYLRTGSGATPEQDVDEMLQACLAHLARSDARLLLVSLEDLWKETHAQNVPGTHRGHANWTHRTPHRFETWRALPDVVSVLQAVHRARRGASAKARVRYDVTRLGDDDLHAFAEGTHARLHDLLGAHPMAVDGEEGTYFAVWAPHARSVSVIGDFNQWERGRCPLHPRSTSGIWEGFVTGVGVGDLYKFHVEAAGFAADKADPLGAAMELPPRTASVVASTAYAWHDEGWMARRASRQALDAPISIYEVHLGSWRRVPEEGDRVLTYRELAPRLVEHVTALGFTHVELMPVMEHASYGSWGYQVTGDFAPTARYGSPRDLMALIDALHQADIGVILDWVPSHFAGDPHGLASFDGTPSYERADPRRDSRPEWQRCIFDYGRAEVRSFLFSSAAHWLDRYHADGLRVDGVASMLGLDDARGPGAWVPDQFGGRENLEAISFLRRLNEILYARFPGIRTFASESTAWPMVSRPTQVGGLGFGFEWDTRWMHDTLAYFGKDPIYRKYHHGDLASRMAWAFSENYVLSLSHDAVVHGTGSLLGKMPGDRWQKFANLRALYGYMYAQPGKKLLFMGQEFGQARQWDHDHSLDWHLLDDSMHRGVQAWVARLNRLYREEPALHQLDADPAGFEWVDVSDADCSVYALLRKPRRGPPVLAICNFTPVPRLEYVVGVPYGGTWLEIGNSDASCYGGSGLGNAGRVAARPDPAHGRPWSLSLTLPPLSVLLLRPDAI